MVPISLDGLVLRFKPPHRMYSGLLKVKSLPWRRAQDFYVNTRLPVLITAMDRDPLPAGADGINSVRVWASSGIAGAPPDILTAWLEDLQKNAHQWWTRLIDCLVDALIEEIRYGVEYAGSYGITTDAEIARVTQQAHDLAQRVADAIQSSEGLSWIVENTCEMDRIHLGLVEGKLLCTFGFSAGWLIEHGKGFLFDGDTLIASGGAHEFDDLGSLDDLAYLRGLKPRRRPLPPSLSFLEQRAAAPAT